METVAVRRLDATDWDAVLRIYSEGIATRRATFDTQTPTRSELDARWLDGHRWVAEVDGTVAGWATLSPVSSRRCFRGVAENSVYTAGEFRGVGVGTALMRRLIDEADFSGIWTLQASVLAVNAGSIALHHAVGYRTVGMRERLAQIDGVWHDSVLLERRRDT
ncbi:GNAT family N-acetyltransferase [Rhodococcus opacus]|uniref:Putative acetyltransferase n=1 Tax=Rhodococcus opacus (strain B4) TaxID=632772 RepID=C1AXK9_RHOOB|nr:GNAT family N-acetyltransferase [Rhodococcus opacus]BAH49713.1 putative acetyltransferase [Rhodococcus opacus B4]